MAVSNVSVQHNGGFLPGILQVTQCYHHPSGNPFECHEEVLYFLQPKILPKRFDIFLFSFEEATRHCSTVVLYQLFANQEIECHEEVFKKNLNASKPSEHPPQVEECLKV